jgi:tetratricopeptide (TPR) repeat protein
MTTPITDGSSGGAVVNARGELIGLSVSGQHDGNLYFAIPVDEIINDLNNNKVNADINEPENFLAEGDKASKKDDYEDAIYYFSKYLEKNHDADVFFRRGYANMKLKKYKQAISDFSSSIPAQSDKYELYFYRANCYYAVRDYKNSINDYSRAIDLAPQFAEFYYNRGYAYYKLKMFEDCMKDWQTAAEANPDYNAELNPLISKIKVEIDNGN